MKITKNSYALKNYINAKTAVLNDLLLSTQDPTEIEKYRYALAVIADVRRICDNRNRY